MGPSYHLLCVIERRTQQFTKELVGGLQHTASVGHKKELIWRDLWAILFGTARSRSVFAEAAFTYDVRFSGR